uniref:Secreted protein n=1 Tax=Ascaris lumbricoides TaxID=6252 RepID=A0A0M3I5P0_ASCLU
MRVFQLSTLLLNILALNLTYKHFTLKLNSILLYVVEILPGQFFTANVSNFSSIFIQRYVLRIVSVAEMYYKFISEVVVPIDESPITKGSCNLGGNHETFDFSKSMLARIDSQLASKLEETDGGIDIRAARWKRPNIDWSESPLRRVAQKVKSTKVPLKNNCPSGMIFHSLRHSFIYLISYNCDISRFVLTFVLISCIKFDGY